MRKELEFLGHRVGGEDISTLEEKVQAVRDWPTPTNLRRAEELHWTGILLQAQKDIDFSWTPECEQAFSSLKKVLTESPILTPPDPNLPFVLDTDASDVGMGAVLSQNQKGRLHAGWKDWRRMSSRWTTGLLEPGARHANADAMSRRSPVLLTLAADIARRERPRRKSSVWGREAWPHA
ncbi:hypothetical protein L3Q82_021768 [Scortum barcoo]|uniref:Uncharacterized protein n=1 Tax=Scortum barcoo TaxID=214431 RepID=A0ACB8X5E4_9TELE|nr:hypothetical protein L3Q82_021768 [Scortum barcoo]